MTDVGIDYSWGRPNLDEVWAAGYRFVLRYISYDTTGKNITPAELSSLLGKGFEVCLNWEHQATDQRGGAAKGTQHATDAVRMAQALGYPTGCTVYFSGDYGTAAADIGPAPAQVGDDYLRAAAAVARAAGYRMGAYGGYDYIRECFDSGLIDDGWQTYAWSHGQWDPRAALRQDHNGITVGGSSDCDHNTRVGATYFMQPAGRPIPSTVEDDTMHMVTAGRATAGGPGTCYAIYPDRVEGGKVLAVPMSNFDRVQAWQAGGVRMVDLGTTPLDPRFFDIARLDAHPAQPGAGASVPPHTHEQPSITGPVTTAPAQPQP